MPSFATGTIRKIWDRALRPLSRHRSTSGRAAFAPTGKSVRLIGLGVRFVGSEQDETQLPLFL
jgi:hypothetical protein